MTQPLIEYAALLVIVLLVSTGVVWWLRSQKRKPHPLVQVLALIVLMAVLMGGMKWGGEALGWVKPSDNSGGEPNDFRKALILLQQPYSTYTTANNLSGTNREALVQRFQDMARLDLGKVKPLVQNLQLLMENAPASGQQGMYNMHMTSEIQARWEELRRELSKRVEQKP